MWGPSDDVICGYPVSMFSSCLILSLPPFKTLSCFLLSYRNIAQSQCNELWMEGNVSSCGWYSSRRMPTDRSKFRRGQEEWSEDWKLNPRRKDWKNSASLALRKEDRGETSEHFSNIWKVVLQRKGRICSPSSQSAGHVRMGSSYRKPDINWISWKTY